MTAAHHLSQDHAEGELVGARVEGLALHLLRRHVTRRPEHHSRLGELQGGVDGRVVPRRGLREPLGHAEVHHLHVPLRGQHDVGGFEIAMEEAARMRFL